jgi:uncharacterized protein (TIGR02145 family)
MRNLIPILLAVVVLSSGCDPDGYSCNSEGCYAENNAQYLTLEDCLSNCVYDCGEVEHQGYSYKTAQIGDQCWFSENCRYLPAVSPSSAYSFTSPYYYVYDYQGTDVEAAKATENYATYGALYNWPAVMTEGFCPSGWHIPSDGEWTQLTNFLGGRVVAGGKMKEAGYDHWNSPNEGATNSNGFNGLPGGKCYWATDFTEIEQIAKYWTSSIEPGYTVLTLSSRSLMHNSAQISPSYGGSSRGYSARCVSD